MFDWISDAIEWAGDQVFGGLNEVGEQFSEAVFNMLIKWLYTSIYDTVSDIFLMLNNLTTGIFELSWVNSFITLFSYLGWTLFVVGIIVAVFDTALEYQNGRANIQGTCINVLKGFMAAGLFTEVPPALYSFCTSLQATFSNELTWSFLGEYFDDVGSAAQRALEVRIGINSLLGVLSMILLAYCVLKLFFANLKRGGILLCQIAVGSLYMFSVPRGYTDGFNSWCKQIIALCLTSFVQTTLLFLGLITWQTNMILAVGIMLSANEVPRIAQQFGLDTSVKINMMSVTSTVNAAVRAGQIVAKKLV